MKCFDLDINDRDIGIKPEQVENWSQRQAARCLIMRENKIALLFLQSFNYHKFPGGGIKTGEEIEEALRREIREEIGSKANVIEKLGRTTSHRSRQGTRHISHFFLANEKESGQPQLTEEEKKQGYTTQWTSLDRIIETLDAEHPDHYVAKFINERDLRVARRLKSSKVL
jgi:ADP-ribose pyrophosphatase